MRQYAWLDCANAVWHLVTEDAKDAVRFWENKESAIAELLEEGMAGLCLGLSPADVGGTGIWTEPTVLFHPLKRTSMASITC